MIVRSVKKIDGYHEVFDIVNSKPFNNFLMVPRKDDGSLSDDYIISHNCGLMDEIEFVPGSNPKMELSKVMRIYRTVKRRIESRFMKLGEVPGKLFLVSSKKSEHDFLEQYINRVRNNPNTMVIDEPVWVIKPAAIYSGKKFKVAVGDKYMVSRIINDDEDPQRYIDQGYRIIEVPVEHRDAFELDINSALMDIAGIAISSTTKFIYYDKLKNCIKDYRNPFKVETIVMRLDDPADIMDYLDKDLLDKRYIGIPAFVHIDTSLTGDLTGISMVVSEGTSKVKRLSHGEIFEISDLVYRTVFMITIQAQGGSEIPFYKIREFIYYLRDELGYDIRKITCDGYQSRDMIQQFKLRGFQSEVLSVDRNPEPYSTLRNAINEGRLIIYNHSILIRELKDLEEDKLTGKVDHPDDSSKDLADSLAGAIYNAFTAKTAPSNLDSGVNAEKIINVMTEIKNAGKKTIDDSWVKNGYKDSNKILAVLDDPDKQARKYVGNVLDWIDDEPDDYDDEDE